MSNNISYSKLFNNIHLIESYLLSEDRKKGKDGRETSKVEKEMSFDGNKAGVHFKLHGLFFGVKSRLHCEVSEILPF